MNRKFHSRRANLAAGVALLGCALAAAGRASAQGMQITTITGINFFGGTGTYAGAAPGSVTVPSINWTGSLVAINNTDTPFYTQTSISNGNLITYTVAYDGGGYDTVMNYVGSPWTTDWLLSGSFTVVLSQAANVGLINGSFWLVNGNLLADGDLVGAGTHTFTYGESHTGSFLFVGLTFTPGGGGAVPLPGAAGLAACGLLAVGRRRRR
jgi:hypothetical protein